ncbi:PPC domain-containing DNA-binding protein [Moorellaceae bacterium AZ2]
MTNLYFKKWESRPGRVLAFRLSYGADLLGALQGIAEEQDIRFGWIKFLGGVKKAKVGYYIQDRKEFITLDLDEPMEILSGMGNISLKEDRPFIHAHVTFLNREGRVLGGHLMEGTVVMAGEVFIQELALPAPPQRVYDEVTGLFLWV